MPRYSYSQSSKISEQQGEQQQSAPTSSTAQQLTPPSSGIDFIDQQRTGETAPIQRKNNGLPAPLQQGIESLSGIAMDDVNVHYNSPKPAQLQAHAYAQGTDIHLASGQEKHLPHEAWHVVQQKQGRVQATRQMKGNIALNDNESLEREADIMGAKALATPIQAKYSNSIYQQQALNTSASANNKPIQRITVGLYYKGGDAFEKNRFNKLLQEHNKEDSVTVSKGTFSMPSSLPKLSTGGNAIGWGKDKGLSKVTDDETVRLVGHGSARLFFAGYRPKGIAQLLNNSGLPKSHKGKIELHGCLTALEKSVRRQQQQNKSIPANFKKSMITDAEAVQGFLKELGYTKNSVHGFAHILWPSGEGVTQKFYKVGEAMLALFVEKGTIPITHEKIQKLKTTALQAGITSTEWDAVIKEGQYDHDLVKNKVNPYYLYEAMKELLAAKDQYVKNAPLSSAPSSQSLSLAPRSQPLSLAPSPNPILINE